MTRTSSSGSRRTWSARLNAQTRRLTQREFVLGLVEAAPDKAERQAAEDSPEPEMEEQPSEGAGVSPCEAQPEGSGAQPQEDGDPAALSAQRAV